MKFSETAVAGCFLVKLEPREDERGFFARLYCDKEFRAHGLDPEIRQMNTAYTKLAGTLRGMHYQTAPFSDTKLVRCLNGAIFDVCVDLRPSSPTFRRWVSAELSAANRTMLFLPEGTAHGYQTLTDDVEILYTTNQPYAPECATGVRYNDPGFDVEWPLGIASISEADEDWKDFTIVGE